MRVVFFGTPEFAVPSLRALLEEGFEVAAVVTQPDRPHGRSRSQLVPPPVKQAALEEELPVLQPERPAAPSLTTSAHSRPDLGVVVAYGHILKPEILAIPRLGMINVHASLLPPLRGAAPIHWAILNGDETTGVSIMQMEAALDTGPVLHQIETEVAADETGGELTERLAELGAAALVEGADPARSGRDSTQAAGPLPRHLRPQSEPDPGPARLDRDAATLARADARLRPGAGGLGHARRTGGEALRRPGRERRRRARHGARSRADSGDRRRGRRTGGQRGTAGRETSACRSPTGCAGGVPPRASASHEAAAPPPRHHRCRRASPRGLPGPRRRHRRGRTRGRPARPGSRSHRRASSARSPADCWPGPAARGRRLRECAGPTSPPRSAPTGCSSACRT